VEHEVKRVGKIKIDGVSLTLITDNRSDKVKESYQISNCRFGLGKAILVGMEFNEM
jgi:hypothetical protein